MKKHLLALGLLALITLSATAPEATSAVAPPKTSDESCMHRGKRISDLTEERLAEIIRALAEKALPKVNAVEIIINRTQIDGPTLIQIRGLRDLDTRIAPNVKASVQIRDDDTYIVISHPRVDVRVERSKSEILPVIMVPDTDGKSVIPAAIIPIPEGMPYRILRSSTKKFFLD